MLNSHNGRLVAIITLLLFIGILLTVRQTAPHKTAVANALPVAGPGDNDLSSPITTTRLVNYLPLLLHFEAGTTSFSDPPLLEFPPTNSTLARTLFNWVDVSGAAGYWFQLATDASFNNIVRNQFVPVSELAFTSTLDGTHYWRVYATDTAPGNGAAGVTGDGPLSDVWLVNLVTYSADLDGDRLLNGWELHGYDSNDDGIPEVDLPTLGASYRHKDIFVEMDYMVRADATFGIGPNQTVLNEIVASFAAAPVTNPDGVTGITIHLEMGDVVPYDETLDPVSTEFYALKDSYFDARKTAVYHYMIWANQYGTSSSSGLSFGIPASDFIVSLGTWNGGNGGTDPQKIGTFIHELGHNLGLTHGGDDHTNYKPNYLSVMNYAFQTIGVYREGSPGHFDYQRFLLPSLDETNLNETVGLNGPPAADSYYTYYRCPNGNYSSWVRANAPIDWNCDNDKIDIGLIANINGDKNGETPIYSVLGSQDNWANIVFGGNGSIGSGQEPGLLAQWIRETAVVPDIVELTFEQNAELHKNLPAYPEHMP